MHQAMPPLNALRAFEAAARHLSLTEAARELAVTPGALSHQIRGLEEFLGLKLFERKVRAIALTPEGRLLYPGLESGLRQMRDAVAAVRQTRNDRVLVVSALPSFTSKWLAPRLYRFLVAHPEIDVRISSSIDKANFVTDGVDVALRNLPVDFEPEAGLAYEKLHDLLFLPVLSPRLAQQHGAIAGPEDLRRLPLIHDETLVGRWQMPDWRDWLAAAGVDDVDLARGVRFNNSDHALAAAVEGAGVLLAHATLANEELAIGRLIAPFGLTLQSRRAMYLVCPRARMDRPHVAAFRAWIVAEMAGMDTTTYGTVSRYRPGQQRNGGNGDQRDGG